MILNKMLKESKNMIPLEQLEFNMNRNIFLHFADKEMMDSFNKKLSKEYLNSRLILCLISTYEKMYIPLSLLFEDSEVNECFLNKAVLFKKGIVEIASSTDDLEEFIPRKQEHYSHVKEKFPLYFNNSWRDIYEMNANISIKNTNTTTYIAKNMINSIRNGSHNDIDNLSDFIPYIIDIIETRGKLAITHSLFKNFFGKNNISKTIQNIINSQITEKYISGYLEYYDASIFSSTGISKFEYLASTFPINDLMLWNAIYGYLGCKEFFISLPLDVIVDIRETSEFKEFIDGIRCIMLRRVEWLFRHDPKEYNKILLNHNISNLQRFICSNLKRRPKTNETDSDMKLISYFSEIREQCYEIIDKKFMIHNTEYYTIKNKKRRDLMSDKEKVFVVQGRNMELNDSIFDFLRSIGLKPLEWEQMINKTKNTSPSIMETINCGMECAQAVIVLLTGDDLVKIDERFLKTDEKPEELSPQPRPNVLLEAGMAMALFPKRTILVKVGKIREITDLAGLHYINFDGDIKSKTTLMTRLKTAGCLVDDDGSQWTRIKINF